MTPLSILDLSPISMGWGEHRVLTRTPVALYDVTQIYNHPARFHCYNILATHLIDGENKLNQVLKSQPRPPKTKTSTE